MWYIWDLGRSHEGRSSGSGKASLPPALGLGNPGSPASFKRPGTRVRGSLAPHDPFTLSSQTQCPPGLLLRGSILSLWDQTRGEAPATLSG